MDDLENISIKSFRGGIAPDGDKGPTGSFKYGHNLNIHGGKDTLKCNQALKKESGTVIVDLPRVIVTASDGNKYAFGDTGKVYRKMAGTWAEVYDANEKISGATEFTSTTGNWLMFATETGLKKILLRQAVLSWTDRVVDVGDFSGITEEVNTFSATYGTSPNYSLWIRGIIEAAGTTPPEVIVGDKASGTGSSSSIGLTLTVPNKPNRVVIVIAGDYSSGSSPTAATIAGNAMSALTSGSGSSGGFSVNYAVYKYVAPATGSNAISVTLQSARTNRFLYAFVVEGGNQATPTSGEASGFSPATQTNVEATVTLAETGDNQFRYALLLSGVTTFIAPDSQTLIASQTVGSAGSGALYYRMPFVPVVAEHQMLVALGSVMICGGEFISLYDFEDAFNPEALALPPGLLAKSLLEQTTSLVDTLIIACDTKSRNAAWFVTWDGVQDTWVLKKPIKANSVDQIAFLEAGITAIADGTGVVKYWNFSDSTPLRTIPNVTGGYSGAVAEYRTIPHFGMGGGTKNGIYSVGRWDKNAPIAINLEYIPSHGQQENCEIGALSSDGDDLYVGWSRTYLTDPEDPESEVTEYGIDVTDQENKAIAIYESLELDMGHPQIEKLIKQVKLVNEALPNGVSITVETKGTRDDDWVLASMGDDSDSLAVEGEKKGVFDIETIGEVYEVRITLTPSGNDGPEIQSISSFYSNDNTI